MLTDVALVVPYYRQPRMLETQRSVWSEYSERVRKHLRIIVIDDGSPEPASDVIRPDDGAALYRIEIDRPWGRNIARNLAATVSKATWLLNVDIDHILPPASAEALLDVEVNEKHWYRFPRYRVGKADETRRKDAIDPACEFGKIKPHIDSHLMARKLFLSSPYDQSYVGFLGGGSPFLSRMESIAPVEVLPDSVCLHVYTKHVVPDASITTLSRDTSKYARMRKIIDQRGEVPKVRLDFPWSRVF